MKKWFCGLIVLLLLGTAIAEDVYYVNPLGGQKYHAVPDCPSISTKYHDGMVQITESELGTQAYLWMEPCNVCGADKSDEADTSDEIIVPSGDYVVGVDIPQGLYAFDGDGGPDSLVVQNWNGDPCSIYSFSGGGSEVIHLYNEYRLHVPEGVQGRFMMQMNMSELDTGTRQLVTTQPGTYWTYSDLNPGLYIVDALETPAGSLRILNKADKRELRRFEMSKGAEYAVYLGSSMMLELPEGCRLRSFCREVKFDSADPVIVDQARYVSGPQIPVGKYRITAQPGKDAWYSVTTVYDDAHGLHKLEQGESVVIDLGAYDTEVFLELIHCVVSYAIADNG